MSSITSAVSRLTPLKRDDRRLKERKKVYEKRIESPQGQLTKIKRVVAELSRKQETAFETRGREEKENEERMREEIERLRKQNERLRVAKRSEAQSQRQEAEEEEKKKEKEKMMQEEITLLREQNERPQAAKQSEGQTSGAASKCNADEPKKQPAPRGTTIEKAKTSPTGQKQLTPSEITTEKAKTSPTSEVASEKAKFAIERETLERGSPRGDVGRVWERAEADGVVEDRDRGDRDRKGKGFAVGREAAERVPS